METPQPLRGLIVFNLILFNTVVVHSEESQRKPVPLLEIRFGGTYYDRKEEGKKGKLRTQPGNVNLYTRQHQHDFARYSKLDNKLHREMVQIAPSDWLGFYRFLDVVMGRAGVPREQRAEGIVMGKIRPLIGPERTFIAMQIRALSKDYVNRNFPIGFIWLLEPGQEVEPKQMDFLQNVYRQLRVVQAELHFNEKDVTKTDFERLREAFRRLNLPEVWNEGTKWNLEIPESIQTANGFDATELNISEKMFRIKDPITHTQGSRLGRALPVIAEMSAIPVGGLMSAAALTFAGWKFYEFRKKKAKESKNAR